ncbi:MAG: ChaN family lipoprotein [Deltaproteobacteria bacterium]|nr:ChaN family lipoprotein [Deltaproteobacteria bacterium]
MRLAVVLLVVCMGCAGAIKPDTETAESIVRSQTAPRSVVDAASGRSIEPEAFFAILRTKTVVYVGERHDDPADHGVQYAILRQLHRDDASLAIGMEMFQTPFQDPLTKWSAGLIDETVLRRETEYDDRWGFDFSMYRPILEYARNRRCLWSKPPACRSSISPMSSTARSSTRSSTRENTPLGMAWTGTTRHRSYGTRRWAPESPRPSADWTGLPR